MIFHTGDLHGEHDISKLNKKNTEFITRDDVLIISGDFGLVWNFKAEKTSKHWRDWLDKKEYKILFCDGNHENFDRLLSDEFPEVDMFGDKVKQISENIFELQTGHIYNIQGKKIFVFGGAQSIDKFYRTPHVSWWSQEIPSCSMFYNGLENLKNIGNNVDIIISHATHRDCFNKAISMMPAIGIEVEEDPLIKMLQTFRETVNYDLWVCGHYHLNCFDGESKTVILYNNIMSSEELIKTINKNEDSFYIKKL
jgi:Icc-related predicted phosphoesterase